MRDARDFNNIETRAVIKFVFSLQGKAAKEIHAIQTETLACFLPGRAKDLSAPLYIRRSEADDVGKTRMRPQKSEMAAYTLLCPATHFADLSNEEKSHGEPEAPLPVFGQP